jgi:cell division protein FtsB
MAQPVDSDVLTVPPRRRETRWIQRVLLFSTVVLLVNGLFGDRGLRETLRARERYDEAVRELATIRQQNAALADQARRLTHDPRTIEAEARHKLGLVKHGEILFMVRTR